MTKSIYNVFSLTPKYSKYERTHLNESLLKEYVKIKCCSQVALH